jgi:peptidoglycan/LPS O-acetylase OafA/YrhL
VQYHARGLPDLRIVQHVLQGALVMGALVLAWWPRVRSPLRFAALTAALLIGFELVLTYWIYLYLPWFFPFVALALIAAPAAAASLSDVATTDVVPTGEDPDGSLFAV